LKYIYIYYILSFENNKFKRNDGQIEIERKPHGDEYGNGKEIKLVLVQFRTSLGID